MSLLDNFLENTAIFRGDENRIDQAAFDKLVEERGEDVARGFLKAAYEITEIINRILMTPCLNEDGTKYPMHTAPGMVKNMIGHFHKALFEFIEKNEIDIHQLERPDFVRSKKQNF